jgi:pyruvate kinase
MIGAMVEAGLNVMRINMAHSSRQFAKECIDRLREYTARSTAQIAICLDINGPKVRTGKLKDGKPVNLHSGDELLICNDDIIGDNTKFSTTYAKELVSPGEKIYVDDGYLSFTVIERVENGIRCRIDNSGLLGENKVFEISIIFPFNIQGINFPSHVIQDLPALSEKDLSDIKFAIQNDVDYVFMSCIRSIEDVQDIR